MTNWKKVVLPGVLLALMYLVPVWCLAQIGDGDPGGDPDAPIDGGVGLLIAAGVGYGVKRYRDAIKLKQ